MKKIFDNPLKNDYIDIMKTKICSRCRIEKQFDEFWNEKNGKYGKRSKCIKCLIEIRKDYENENSEILKSRNSEYRSKNKERINENNRRYKKNNKEKTLKYNDNNKENIKEYHKEYSNSKYKNDNQYKMANKLRSRIRRACCLQSTSKHTKTAILIGMSIKELCDYLDYNNTNIDNPQIDHVIPISLFDLSIKEHQLVACHYKNLQLLSAQDNIRKSNKLSDGWEILLKEICNHRNIKYDDICNHIKGGSGVQCNQM